MAAQPRPTQLPDRFIPVTLETGQRVVINLDTVAYAMRHIHAEPADHEHAGELIELRLISGASVPIVDDGRWGV